MTSLTTFPVPLLRPILCGGKGLAPAWGPLACPDWSTRAYAWNPMTCDVTFPRGMSEESSGPPRPLVAPEAWFMPLDAASPWPARLAMVAAYLTWLATSPKVLVNPPAFDMIAASVDQVFDEWEKGRVVALTRLAHRGPLPSIHAWKWSATTGFCWGNGPRLTTLPEHLQTHPPIVATLLALFDVPEVRARVEQT